MAKQQTDATRGGIVTTSGRSTSHKMTMVNSKGRTTTAPGKTGASNMGRGKFGTTPN